MFYSEKFLVVDFTSFANHAKGEISKDIILKKLTKEEEKKRKDDGNILEEHSVFCTTHYQILRVIAYSIQFKLTRHNCRKISIHKLTKFQAFLWRIKYEKSKCCLTVFHRGSYAKAVTPTNRKSLNCNRDIRELAMVISDNIVVRNRQMRFVKWIGECIGLYTCASNRDIGMRGKCNGARHLETPTRVKRREGLREISYLRWRVSIVALSHKCYNIRWV